MSDVRKPEESGAPPAIEPDPGLDQLLKMLGSAVPREAADGSGYFDNLTIRTDDRISSHLTRSALGGGFPSTVDMRVAGVLVPKRRTPVLAYVLGIGGGVVALGLLGVIGYLLLLKPGGPLDGPKTVALGAGYEASRGTAAPVTAAPVTVAMVAPATAADVIEAPPETAGSDEIAYAEDDETKKVMAGMTGKPKAGAGAGAAKKAAGPAAKGPGDDAPDAVTTSAPAAAGASKTKVADPSKAGAFDEDLTKLLEKKKADAATAAPAAEPVDTSRKLGADDVKKVLGAAKGRIALCGKIEETDITVSFEINPDGTLGKLSPKGAHASSAVGACVTGILKGLKFPEHDGKPIKVTQTWKLVGAAE